MTVTSCDGCGVCCRNQPFPPFLSRDGDDLPDELAAELLAAEKREPTASCLWFDEATNRCRHYEHRPSLCREFELGGDVCLDVRQMYQIV